MTFKEWKNELCVLLSSEMGHMKIGAARLPKAREYFECGLSPQEFFDDSFVGGLHDSADPGFDLHQELGFISR